jgi:hypothetical protein
MSSLVDGAAPLVPRRMQQTEALIVADGIDRNPGSQYELRQ